MATLYAEAKTLLRLRNDEQSAIPRALHRNHRRPAPPRKRAQTQTLSLGFTSHYNLTRLVYCEVFSYPGDAIAREKEIKGWVRSKKIKLIESINPNWHDLAAD